MWLYRDVQEFYERAILTNREDHQLSIVTLMPFGLLLDGPYLLNIPI